jgi:hypothetical protein
LAVLAVAVLSGAVYAVKHGNTVDAAASSTLTVAPAAARTGVPSSRPTTTSPATLSPAPSSSPGVLATRPARASSVVLAGADLVQLKADLVTATGYAVQTVDSAGPEVLAPGALDAVTGTPSAVVLEVLAGSRTSARAASAIAAVKAAFPRAQVLVVGPFSSGDRKSAEAVRGAAANAGVTFLDPVDLKWRTSDLSPSLSAADLHSVALALANALA